MNTEVLKVLLSVLEGAEPFIIHHRNDSALNEEIPVVRLDKLIESIKERIWTEEFNAS